MAAKLLFVAIALSLTAYRVDARRGVPPSKESVYAGANDNFKCFDGSATLKTSAINDNYCDCKDGSDEPGTSACANGRFWCENKGHREEYLMSSRVDDGICDCCDGTDESQVSCANTCAELGQAAREEAFKQHQKQMVGYTKRLEYQRLGAEKRRERVTRIQELEQLLVDAQKTASDWNVVKKAAEDAEKQAKSAVDEAFAQATKAYDDSIKTASFALIDVDKDSFITEADIVVNSAFASDSEGAPTHDDVMVWMDLDESGDLSEQEAKVSFESFGKLHAKLPTALQNPNEEQQPIKGNYSDDVQKLIDVAEEARKESTKANELENQITTEISKLKREQEFNTGNNHEFEALVNQCYDVIDREYKYKLCPFDKVMQEPKNGGRGTSLGTWKRWDNAGTNNEFAMMVFENGERCWNGPDRSMKVTVECGLMDEVSSVLEPSRCEYSMILTTPAACVQPAQRDEL